MLSLDGIPLLGTFNGTSMQSLTLAIWGAYRTLDGPGFEPLISKATE